MLRPATISSRRVCAAVSSPLIGEPESLMFSKRCQRPTGASVRSAPNATNNAQSVAGLRRVRSSAAKPTTASASSPPRDCVRYVAPARLAAVNATSVRQSSLPSACPIQIVAALSMVESHPLLGVGLDGFKAAAPSYDPRLGEPGT